MSKAIHIVKKITLTTFLLSLAVFIFSLFYKQPLPGKEGVSQVIKEEEPRQKEVDKEEMLLSIGEFEYQIEPLHEYEIWGIVVSEYDSRNWLDYMHKNDPLNVKDICVVWGKNVPDEVYRKVKFKSGEFTCYYRWSGQMENIFYGDSFSNNHLIPASEDIDQVITKMAIGDQVRIKGYLSNYQVSNESGDLVSSRKTSVKRDDTGNGACETIYVTEAEILSGWGNMVREVRTISSKAALGAFALGLLLLFF